MGLSPKQVMCYIRVIQQHHAAAAMGEGRLACFSGMLYFFLGVALVLSSCFNQQYNPRPTAVQDRCCFALTL